ncbi:hypothetical protein D3C84_642180 [compost metagenome]
MVGFSVPYKIIAKGDQVCSLSGFLNSIEMAINSHGDDYSDMRKLLNIKSDGNCFEHFLEIERLRIR